MDTVNGGLFADNFGTVNLASLGSGLFLSESHDATGIEITVDSVAPEPSTLVLIGAGLLGLAFCRRRVIAHTNPV